jgi:tRNA pseudouridine38-40 synthase
MARYFLSLSYNGRYFNGWQIQKNTPHTVQQVMEEKLSMLLREKITMTGCGRTDTGVNGKNFIAHFDAGRIEEKPLSHWIFKLNTVLPEGIAVDRIWKVTADAHARFDAQERMYYYYLSLKKDPFRNQFSWLVNEQPDFKVMNAAADILLKHSDFLAFSKSNTQNKTSICHIKEARWLQSGTHEWRFSIRADRFLRGMVRAIVGTMMLAGKGKISLQEFEAIIVSRDRKYAGENAPAHALFFAGVKYPSSIFLNGEA